MNGMLLPRLIRAILQGDVARLTKIKPRGRKFSSTRICNGDDVQCALSYHKNDTVSSKILRLHFSQCEIVAAPIRCPKKEGSKAHVTMQGQALRTNTLQAGPVDVSRSAW